MTTQQEIYYTIVELGKIIPINVDMKKDNKLLRKDLMNCNAMQVTSRRSNIRVISIIDRVAMFNRPNPFCIHSPSSPQLKMKTNQVDRVNGSSAVPPITKY